MGQRHQLFIIAKPKGQQYHSLAAVHHQWLYGVSALSTCWRLLQIFSDEANRTAIQQELAFAADFFGNASAAEIKALRARNRMSQGEMAVPCPFPFITTCLIVGASCNPDLGNCTSVDEEDFEMRYNEGDNNNGITILDITDLSNVRYCFVDYFGMESEREVPLHTPLDGWTYLRAYYNDSNKIVLENKVVTDALEKYAVVELGALAECWPEGGWQIAAGAGETEVELSHGDTKKEAVPSLRSLSQHKLFQELLSSDGPPDLTLLDSPMLLSGFKRDMQRYLIENTDALSKSPAAVEILEKAFATEKQFDFAPFHAKLAAEDLVALAGSEALSNVKTANLSGFDSETDSKTVAAIAERLKLDSLYLLSRPDRSTENPWEMLDSLTKGSSRPLVNQKLVLSSGFSRSIRQNFWAPRTPTTVDPRLWKTFPVVQLLYRGPQDFGPISRTKKPWVTDFFLGDAFLSPVRFVTGLLNVIKGRFQEPRQAGIMHGELDVPLTFACAPSSLKALAAATEVSPIPAEAFARGKQEYHSSRGANSTVPIRDLDPEGWTAIVVHTATVDPVNLCQEAVKTRFRVALVRSKGRPIPLIFSTVSPEKLEVVDLGGFLELTAPEYTDDLQVCLSGLTAWAHTDEELVSKLTVDEVVTTLQTFVDGSVQLDSDVD